MLPHHTLAVVAGSAVGTVPRHRRRPLWRHKVCAAAGASAGAVAATAAVVPVGVHRSIERASERAFVLRGQRQVRLCDGWCGGCAVVGGRAGGRTTRVDDDLATYTAFFLRWYVVGVVLWVLMGGRRDMRPRLRLRFAPSTAAVPRRPRPPVTRLYRLDSSSHVSETSLGVWLCARVHGVCGVCGGPESSCWLRLGRRAPCACVYVCCGDCALVRRRRLGVWWAGGAVTSACACVRARRRAHRAVVSVKAQVEYHQSWGHCVSAAVVTARLPLCWPGRGRQPCAWMPGGGAAAWRNS